MAKQRKRSTARAAARTRAENARREATLYDVRHAELLAGTNGAVPTIAEGTGSVAGGFRAGKRKRGSSLLNVNAKQRTKNAQVRVLPVDVTTESGILHANVRTLELAPNVEVTFANRTNPAPPANPARSAHSATHTDAKLAALLALLDAKIAECVRAENALAAKNAKPRTIAQEVRAAVKNGVSRELAISRAIAKRMPQRPAGAYLP